eukprot:scaffold111725_cov57-Phaeocystis_antarctica.AAC.1
MVYKPNVQITSTDSSLKPVRASTGRLNATPSSTPSTTSAVVRTRQPSSTWPPYVRHSRSEIDMWRWCPVADSVPARLACSGGAQRGAGAGAAHAGEDHGREDASLRREAPQRDRQVIARQQPEHVRAHRHRLRGGEAVLGRAARCGGGCGGGVAQAQDLGVERAG